MTKEDEQIALECWKQVHGFDAVSLKPTILEFLRLFMEKKNEREQENTKER